MTHTPGPWERDGWGGIVANINGEKRSVARVYWENDRLAEAEANERLIKAATDLLAACELAAEVIRFQSSSSARDASIAIDEAIKKARGE